MEARKDISYTTDATAHRRTDSPQRVHGDAADAEYKTDPSLEPIVVGTDGTVCMPLLNVDDLRLSPFFIVILAHGSPSASGRTIYMENTAKRRPRD
jgi:hypothetical protein